MASRSTACFIDWRQVVTMATIDHFAASNDAGGTLLEANRLMT